MHRLKAVVRFGDVTWPARVLLWVIVVNAVLEVLKVIARHAA